MVGREELQRQLDLIQVPDAPSHLKALYQNEPEFHAITSQLVRLMDEYGRTTVHDALWLADLIDRKRIEERLYNVGP